MGSDPRWTGYRRCLLLCLRQSKDMRVSSTRETAPMVCNEKVPGSIPNLAVWMFHELHPPGGSFTSHSPKTFMCGYLEVLAYNEKVLGSVPILSLCGRSKSFMFNVSFQFPPTVQKTVMCGHLEVRFPPTVQKHSNEVNRLVMRRSWIQSQCCLCASFMFAGSSWSGFLPQSKNRTFMCDHLVVWFPPQNRDVIMSLP